jgi:hypothetical protein
MARSGVVLDLDTGGIGELVVYLRKVEPDLARMLPREMRQVAKPVVQTARALIPADRPLSNWGSWGGRLDWSRKAVTGIVATTDVRAGKSSPGQINLLSIQQKNAAGAVFENAGRHPNAATARGRAFIRNLDRRHGEPLKGRYLWPAVEQNLGYLNRELQDVIDKWSAELERTLARAA